MELYDREHIKDFYNDYGELETQRWNKSIVEQVKYFVHLHYLNRFVESGDSILELGAGTGMFTKELARYASDLVVTDLSPVQLELNKQRGLSFASVVRFKMQIWYSPTRGHFSRGFSMSMGCRVHQEVKGLPNDDQLR